MVYKFVSYINFEVSMVGRVSSPSRNLLHVNRCNRQLKKNICTCYRYSVKVKQFDCGRNSLFPQPFYVKENVNPNPCVPLNKFLFYWCGIYSWSFRPKRSLTRLKHEWVSWETACQFRCPKYKTFDYLNHCTSSRSINWCWPHDNLSCDFFRKFRLKNSFLLEIFGLKTNYVEPFYRKKSVNIRNI